MLRSLFLLWVLLVASVWVFAQKEEQPKGSGLGIEFTPKVLSMVKHTTNFTGPISKFCYGFDLNIIRQHYGKKPWHQLRNYPMLGASISYLNYNNESVYGHVIGISPLMVLPLLRNEQWEWTFRAGMGIGIATRYYNRKTNNNTENVAIGGLINNVSPFATDLRFKPNEHWQLSMGLSFTHVSNATLQVPNLGINTWGGHVGVRYFPVTSTPQKISYKPAPSFRNNYMFFAKASIAYKETGAPDGPMFRTYIGQLGVAKRYASKNKVYTGIDYHYHSMKYHFAINSGATVANKMHLAGQFGLFLGHEFIYGKVGLVGQLGYYIVPALDQKERLYQKIGLNYYVIRREKGFLQELYIGGILKTHLTVAELFELGIGVSF